MPTDLPAGYEPPKKPRSVTPSLDALAEALAAERNWWDCGADRAVTEEETRRAAVRLLTAMGKAQHQLTASGFVVFFMLCAVPVLIVWLLTR